MIERLKVNSLLLIISSKKLKSLIFIKIHTWPNQNCHFTVNWNIFKCLSLCIMREKITFYSEGLKNERKPRVVLLVFS